jgi:hypothetical protein
MTERHHDIELAVGGGARWMSYRELADARGISIASAARLVLRRRWPRQPGNDGSTRVAVPLSEIEPSARHQTDDGPSSAPVTPPDIYPDIGRLVSGLEAAVAALTVRAETADRRADQAEARADAERARADQTAAARLAAEARADRTDAALVGERARADALRDRIEALQARLAAAEAEGTASDVEAAEMTTQLKQARAEAQAAQDRAAEAERTDAARRSAGVLARLRAAWRGE